MKNASIGLGVSENKQLVKQKIDQREGNEIQDTNY